MQLIVNDLTKVYGTSTPLTATLLNDDDSPVSGVGVTFTINGVSYTRTTDSNGVARLNINLPIGVYQCTVQCVPLSKTVTVWVRDKYGVSLIVNPLTKTYGVAGALKCTLYGERAEVLAGRRIQYTINGVTYNRTTDNDGQASLAINLRPGTYPCTVRFVGDDEHGSSSTTVDVTVKADTFIDGTDVDKKYSDAGFFQCAVYDQWERLNPVTVSLSVNGVTYNRSSDKDGLIRLNIRLPPGEYALTVRFNGDAKHNGSTLTKIVRVREDVEGLTVKVPGGYTIPSNNQGFIESKIYSTTFKYDVNKKNNWVYETPNWDTIIGLNHVDNIRFTTYEITETDGRVKTAKFTTDTYLDLTLGRVWVYITSPYHENFGGRILKVDYDKSTGLYTYQCQDGRRQYISKRRFTMNNGIIYDALELALITPSMYKKGGATFPIPKELREKHAKSLSGLHPIGDYDKLKLSPVLKGDNPFKQRVTGLSYDSIIDVITNLAKNGQYPIDVWFDPSGICHIDPIDLDKWLKQGIRLVHSDLISYKYGFDTTNIITGVTLKSKDEENASGYYDEFAELTYFFGVNFGSVDPVTTTTSSTGGTSSSSDTSSTSTSTSGTATGNGVVINPKTGCRDNSGANIPKNMPIVISIDNIGTYSQDMQFMRNVKSALQGHGYTNVTISGVGPGYHNKDVERASPNTCCLTIFGGYCACTFSDYWGYLKSKIKSGVKIVAGFTNMPNYHANKPSSINPNGTHLDKITWLPKPWDMSCGISGLSNPGQKILNAGVNWVYGDTAQELADNLAKGNSGGSATTTTTTSTGSGSSNTTTVTDSVATYNKALEAMSQSVRDLLSFEIELPLNNPVFKNLHTNQMLWTELPKEFKLTNLEKIFKILPSYKVNRGVPYQENRWYVEKLVIKHDGKGPIAKITLNPFPSSYSVYSNAVKSYAEAYDQAFKQNTTTENATTTTSTTGTGQARLGRDSTDTNSMRAMSGGYRGNAGDNKNFDAAAKKGYAQQGRKYYDWARQYSTPLALAKALVSRFHYVGYSGNHHANAEVTHNNGGTINCNCYDACRLVKCCFDAADFDCVVITGTIYKGGHGWNAVKHNGRWYSFDLCYPVTGKEWQGTNSLRLCKEW